MEDFSDQLLMMDQIKVTKKILHQLLMNYFQMEVENSKIIEELSFLSSDIKRRSLADTHNAILLCLVEQEIIISIRLLLYKQMLNKGQQKFLEGLIKTYFSLFNNNCIIMILIIQFCLWTILF